MGKMYTIGDAADELGMPASTIRFYEKNGLIPNQQRPWQGAAAHAAARTRRARSGGPPAQRPPLRRRPGGLGREPGALAVKVVVLQGSPNAGGSTAILAGDSPVGRGRRGMKLVCRVGVLGRETAVEGAHHLGVPAHRVVAHPCVAGNEGARVACGNALVALEVRLAQVARAFGLPEAERVVLMMPLGYPAEGAKPAKWHADKKPLAETVRYL